jgi:hypothetical protein
LPGCKGDHTQASSDEHGVPRALAFFPGRVTTHPEPDRAESNNTATDDTDSFVPPGWQTRNGTAVPTGGRCIRPLRARHGCRAERDRPAAAHPRLRAREIRLWIKRHLARCVHLTLAGTRFDALRWVVPGTGQNVGGAVADGDATQKSPIPCIRPRLVGSASQLREVEPPGEGPWGTLSERVACRALLLQA